MARWLFLETQKQWSPNTHPMGYAAKWAQEQLTHQLDQKPKRSYFLSHTLVQKKSTLNFRRRFVKS